MLRKMNRKEEGFTLIELMIVIAIIGILAAIAIPQFSAYRVRSYNSASQADLRNAATAQEAYFVDESTYCNSLATLIGATYGLYTSARVNMSIKNATQQSYSMVSWNNSGNHSYVLRGPGGSLSEFN